LLHLAHASWLTTTTIEPTLAAGGVGPYWRFVGVFHPAVAHFPIALLMVAALVECWSVYRRHRKPLHTTLVCLYIGTLAAVVATTLGWASADASGDRGTIVTLHRWLGVSVAVLAVTSVVLSVFAHRPDARRRIVWAYRGGMFAAAALVGLVGSYGGKLVHGATYYDDAIATLRQEIGTNDVAKGEPLPHDPAEVAATKPASKPSTQTAAAEAPSQTTSPTTVPAQPALASAAEFGGGRIDYARDVEPIFLAHCVKCHNEMKKKGGYRLDATDHVFAAGESGSVPIIPGRADESRLVKMIEGKGEFADSVMPPKGTPLSFQEIALIRRWIDEGALVSH
jgi:uncharacterized membrane protein